MREKFFLNFSLKIKHFYKKLKSLPYNMLKLDEFIIIHFMFWVKENGSNSSDLWHLILIGNC